MKVKVPIFSEGRGELNKVLNDNLNQIEMARSVAATPTTCTASALRTAQRALQFNFEMWGFGYSIS
jgi:hypothetical protein